MIWLLRHGDAEDGSPDAARRLTGTGERQALAAGRLLRTLGVKLDACLTSPRVRAADTARIACAETGVEVAVEPALAGGEFDPERLAAGLDEVLLVAHEPDLSNAVGDLTGARVRMEKGALAAVDRRELRVLLGPDEIAAIAE